MSVIERERVVTDADVLNRAAELIETVGWCQGTYGGRDVGHFCLVGAVDEAMWELRGLEFFYDLFELPLPTYFGKQSPHHWNDRPERTREEVVAKLRELAEGASGA